MQKTKGLPINNAEPRVMHIDLNSCFATIEKQSNRLLRNRPVGIAAYDTPKGFLVAACYQAKAKGVKLGVNVQEAKAMCPGIVIITPDPAKYREAHRRFKELLLEYTDDVAPKSIDEFVLDLSNSPILRKKTQEHAGRLSESRISKSEKDNAVGLAMEEIGTDIKQLIYERLGEAVTVNIGIGPNRFLAKYAAGFDKPDGMTRIDYASLKTHYRCRKPKTCTGSTDAAPDRCVVCGGVDLIDLPGINVRYKARLQSYGIMTPLDFLRADRRVLEKVVFKSIVGYYWYLRLRGYEIDKFESKRGQIGHQYALPRKTADKDELARLLMKLCEKVGRRLRKISMTAGGIHLYLSFMSYQESAHRDNGFIGGENQASGNSWHRGQKVGYRLYSSDGIYRAAKGLLMQADIPRKVRGMSITVYNLQPADPEQLSLLVEERGFAAERNVSDAIDAINNRYGEFVITPAAMMDMNGEILDRIAFGSVRDV